MEDVVVEDQIVILNKERESNICTSGGYQYALGAGGTLNLCLYGEGTVTYARGGA